VSGATIVSAAMGLSIFRVRAPIAAFGRNA